MYSNVIRDYLEPEEAIKIARRELAEFDLKADVSLASYFPSEEINDVEFDIEVEVEEDAVIADWRSFNGQATSETFGKAARMQGALQPIARNYVIDEYRKIKARRDSEDRLRTNATKLIQRGARAIGAAVNLQRYNALVDAKVDIVGPNLKETVDFGRRPDFNTTAPKLWSDPDANPLDQLSTWCLEYEKVNGFKPAGLAMAGPVKHALFRHPAVIKQAGLNARYVNSPDMLPKSLIEDVLETFELPTIVNMTSKTVAYNDFSDSRWATKKKPYFPQDIVVLVPEDGDPADPLANPYGRTFWGEPASMEIPEFKGAGSELGVAGICAGIFQGNAWPASIEVVVDALAMPVVLSPNYTLKAKVL